MITCPADVSVNVDPGSCTTSFTTNSDLKNAKYVDIDAVVLRHSPSDVLTLGANTITWTATDTLRQTATCTQKVTVVGRYMSTRFFASAQPLPAGLCALIVLTANFIDCDKADLNDGYMVR